MKIYIKYILSISIVVLTSFASAQMNERGKKNFFLEPESVFNFSNAKKSAYTGNKCGLSNGVSGGKIFSKFIKAGLVCRYNQTIIGTWQDTLQGVDPQTYLDYEKISSTYAGLEAELMFPFLSFSLGKSKRYECKTLTNFLAMGTEFGFNFGGSSTLYTLKANQLFLNASWLFLLKNSGSKKKQAANDIYFCINMKHGQTPFAQRSGGGEKFYSTYWGISILWVRYKTSNWLK